MIIPLTVNVREDLPIKMGATAGLTAGVTGVTAGGYADPGNTLKGWVYGLERRVTGTLIEGSEYGVDENGNWALLNLNDVIQPGEIFVHHFVPEIIQVPYIPYVPAPGYASINPVQYVVDIIGSVVAEADIATFDIVGKHLNYLYGHYKDVVKALGSLSNSPVATDGASRYPLVALFMDFKEKRGQQVGVYSTATLNMIIANYTDPTLTPAQRYTQNYKPILYPIYSAFLDALFYKPGVFLRNEDQIPHTKIDRISWGKEGLLGNTANLFNDTLDAIEIQNLEVKFYIEDYDPATFPSGFNSFQNL